MATSKQRAAARRNIKKAAAAAKKRRTIAHLPKSTRTALGKQAASVARKNAQLGTNIRFPFCVTSNIRIAGEKEMQRDESALAEGNNPTCEECLIELVV